MGYLLHNFTLPIVVQDGKRKKEKMTCPFNESATKCHHNSAPWAKERPFDNLLLSIQFLRR
jgi:hypothetical protein